MYSGALRVLALGVVGVSIELSSECWNSQAVEKLVFDPAVSGIGLRLDDNPLPRAEGPCKEGLACACPASKGFRTSCATLMTTSNREASSAVGSRYKKTLSP